MKHKINKVEIGINERLNKPTGEIIFRRINTNLTDLELRRINEYISLSLTNSELIRLRDALKLYFGY